MAANYIQAGSVVTVPAPALISSGGVVTAGNIAGVAMGSASAGQPVDVAVAGVFELPKVAAENQTLGAAVYFDATAGLVTLDSDTGANPRLGTVVKAAPATVGAVAVRLVSV